MVKATQSKGAMIPHPKMCQEKLRWTTGQLKQLTATKPIDTCRLGHPIKKRKEWYRGTDQCPISNVIKID